jgi:lipopolysaccharide transport system ATP-binding protein
MAIDLKFDGVSKRYRIQQAEAGSRSAMSFLRRMRSRFRHRQDFWAVSDLNFEVPRGQALGIIGHNGAGKSTILKLVSSITAPTLGEITIQGRVAALLEVGSGFHPELTGRENVFLSGAILGMRRAETRANLESIIDFAEIRQFIDVPVKRYSSGMYVRLGFSIAAHLNPDVLLLDEVLAVGDSAFQQKCIQRVLELKRRGLTIVFISHDLSAVGQLCDRVLVMQSGKVIYDGATDDAIAHYRSLGQFHARSVEDPLAEGRTGDITGLTFLDGDGNAASSFSTGAPLCARISYLAHRPIQAAGFNLFFWSLDARLHCQFSTFLSGPVLDLEPGAGTVEFRCEELGLQPGVYVIDVNMEELGNARNLDWQSRCTTVQVSAGKKVRGEFFSPHTWTHLERP